MGDHTVTISWEDDLIEDIEACGLCCPTLQIIKLQTPNKIVNKHYITQTFYHELVHYALHQMGEMDLYSDERFVDGLSHMLHQFHMTREG